MQTRTHKAQILIHSEIYLLVAILILLFPMKWIIGWILATFVHELGHYISIYICGNSIYEISIGANGIIMRTDTLRPKHEFICALAGPVSGLTLLIFAKILPITAICAFAQTVFNLLPLFPLDGGRALMCLLQWLFSTSVACRIMQVCISVILILLVVAGLYCTIELQLGTLPTIAAVLLIVKIKSCKQ